MRQVRVLTWFVGPLALAAKSGIVTEDGKLNSAALFSGPPWVALACYAIVLLVMLVAARWGGVPILKAHAKGLFSTLARSPGNRDVELAVARLAGTMRQHDLSEADAYSLAKLAVAAFNKVVREHTGVSGSKVISLAWDRFKEEIPLPLWTRMRTHALSVPGNPEQIQ